MRGILRTAMLGILAALSASAAWAEPIAVNYLATDDQTVTTAPLRDRNLVNAWGISNSPTSPFWVSDNGTGVSTLYRVDPATNAITKVPLTVTIPGDGSVTGQVFNGGAGAGAFNGNNFLFVSEDGTVSGWRGALGTHAETLVLPDAANIYKGSAFASFGGHSYLYATNFGTGAIDVVKGDAGAPAVTGSFVDPGIPTGFAPFNIQNIGGKLYVTYALKSGEDDVAGVGNGFVSAFDLNGNFLGRVGSQGTLNSPWGLALAPTSFGAIAGDLLVGNFGDGKINVFDPNTNTFVKQLTDARGNLVTIDGLWALTPGNGGGAGSVNSIYFTAGPAGESHGAFGALVAVPEPSQTVLAAAVLAVGFVARRFRRGRAVAPADPSSA